MKWQNLEIKDFLGISTKRLPPINACSDCIGLDLRDTNGDIVSPPKISSLYSAPDTSPVSFTNLYDSQFTTPQEVMVYACQKTVVPLAGSVSSSIWDRKMMAFYIRPYWDGAAWVDNWEWLNAIYITTINSKNGTATYKLNNSSSLIFVGSTKAYPIYNFTKGEWDTIKKIVYTTENNYVINRDTWSPNDVVAVMRDYVPFTNYSAIYSSTINDIVFHKALNDVKMGFGGKPNTLALSLGHRVIKFKSDDSDFIYNSFNDIILYPINLKSETYSGSAWTDGGTYNLNLSRGAGGAPSYAFPKDFGRYAYVAFTAVLDGFQEFLVSEQTVDLWGDDKGGDGTQIIYASPSLRFATVNKRITSLKVYIAGSDPSGQTKRISDYFLVQEILVADAVGGEGWTFDTSGNLILKDTSSPSAHSNPVIGDQVTYLNRFTIYYGMYLSAISTDNGRIPKTLEKSLGYTPTTVYVNDWAQAVALNGRTYVLNPYDDSPHKNFIMASAISGDGALMYDVITPDIYIPLDNKDGNDIVDMTILGNMELFIGRQNGFQILNPDSQVVQSNYVGFGIASKNSVTNINDRIAFASQFDFIRFGYGSLENLSQDTIRDAYRALTPSTMFSTKDNYGNALRLYDGSTSYEYVYTQDKGFVKIAPNNYAWKFYGLSSDGSVLFMDSQGTLFKINNLTFSLGSFTWKSVPISIPLMGNQFNSFDRIVVRSFWMFYESPCPISVQFQYDNNALTSVLYAMPTLNVASTFTLGGNVLAGDTTIDFGIARTPGEVVLLQASFSSFEYVLVGTLVSGTTYNVTRGIYGTTGLGWSSGKSYSVLGTTSSPSMYSQVLAPGKNAKSLQIVLSGNGSSNSVNKLRIRSLGIEWGIRRVGLFG